MEVVVSVVGNKYKQNKEKTSFWERTKRSTSRQDANTDFKFNGF